MKITVIKDNCQVIIEDGDLSSNDSEWAYERVKALLQQAVDDIITIYVIGK